MSASSEKAPADGGTIAARGSFAALRNAVRNLLTGGSDRARLQQDALIAFSVRVLSAAILYLTQIALARWMGSAEYGIYVFVWTWVLVLGGLANLGLATVMIRLVPEYREKADFSRLRGLLLAGRLMAVAASTLAALAALAALVLLGDRIAQPYVWPLFLALACLPMITLSDIHDGIGRGAGWLTVSLIPPYVLRPLLVLAAMAAAHQAGWQVSAETAMAAAVIATWAATLIQLCLLERNIAREIPAAPRTTQSIGWLRTSLPLLAISGSELLIQNTDLLVIGNVLPPQQGAVYFAAAKTIALIMFVHYAVGSAMAKRFSALNAKGDDASLRAFARDAVHWTFWPSLAAAAGLLLLGRPLLGLFGPQFMDGYPVMFILVLGFLGRAAMGPSEFLLNMLGQQRACAAIIVTAAVLNILLQLALVPRYGIIGAAISTTIVLTSAALANTVVARRRLGIDIAIWRNIGRR